jgi:hypothetical protein
MTTPANEKFAYIMIFIKGTYLIAQLSVFCFAYTKFEFCPCNSAFLHVPNYFVGATKKSLLDMLGYQFSSIYNHMDSIFID